MNNGKVDWEEYSFTGSTAVDIDWEPEKLIAIRTIQINFNEAVSAADIVTAKILNSAGKTVFNFGSFTPAFESSETEFSAVCENEEAPIVPVDGKVTVDFANTDDIDPIEVIIGYRKVHADKLGYR